MSRWKRSSSGTVSRSATCSRGADPMSVGPEKAAMGEGTHRARSSGPALLLDQVGDVLEEERSEPGEGDVAVAGLDPVLAGADDQT